MGTRDVGSVLTAALRGVAPRGVHVGVQALVVVVECWKLCATLGIGVEYCFEEKPGFVVVDVCGALGMPR